MCRHSVQSLPSICVSVTFLLVVVFNLDKCSVEGAGLGIEVNPKVTPSDIIFHNVNAGASSRDNSSLSKPPQTKIDDRQSASLQVQEEPPSQEKILHPTDSKKTNSTSQLPSDKETSVSSGVNQCDGESCKSSMQQTKPKEEETKEKPSHAVSHLSEFEEKNFPKKPSRDAFIRGIYVLSGLSFIAIVYFTWQSYRLRRKKTHIHRYGVVANREDLEMAPLEMDDDEDDTTHFDLSNHLPK